MKEKTTGKGTLLNVNTSEPAITIEEKMRRIMKGEEESAGARQPYYTDRKDGVLYETNIRSDRMEAMMIAQDKLTRETLSKRAEYYKEKDITATQSTEGTGGEQQAD